MIQENSVAEGYVLVSLSGSIYVEEAAQLRESMMGFIENGHNTFILDLGDVDYIDSAGLGTLLAIQKRALKQGGGIIVRGLQGLVKDLFELARFTSVFKIQ